MLLGRLLLFIAAGAQVVPTNLLTNPSFDNGQFDSSAGNQPGLPAGSTAVAGWTAYQVGPPVAGDPVSWLQMPYGNLTPSDFNPQSAYHRWIDLTGYQISATSFGGIRQDIVTTPGRLYLVSFDVGVCVGIQACGLGGGLAGPVFVKATAGSTTRTFVHNPSGVGNLWGTYRFTFIATNATTTISFEGAGSNPINRRYMGLDNAIVEYIGR